MQLLVQRRVEPALVQLVQAAAEGARPARTPRSGARGQPRVGRARAGGSAAHVRDKVFKGDAAIAGRVHDQEAAVPLLLGHVRVAQVVDELGRGAASGTRAGCGGPQQRAVGPLGRGQRRTYVHKVVVVEEAALLLVKQVELRAVPRLLVGGRGRLWRARGTEQSGRMSLGRPRTAVRPPGTGARTFRRFMAGSAGGAAPARRGPGAASALHAVRTLALAWCVQRGGTQPRDRPRRAASRPSACLGRCLAHPAIPPGRAPSAANGTLAGASAPLFDGIPAGRGAIQRPTLRPSPRPRTPIDASRCPRSSCATAASDARPWTGAQRGRSEAASTASAHARRQRNGRPVDNARRWDAGSPTLPYSKRRSSGRPA